MWRTFVTCLCVLWIVSRPNKELYLWFKQRIAQCTRWKKLSATALIRVSWNTVTVSVKQGQDQLKMWMLLRYRWQLSMTVQDNICCKPKTRRVLQKTGQWHRAETFLEEAVNCNTQVMLYLGCMFANLLQLKKSIINSVWIWSLDVCEHDRLLRTYTAAKAVWVVAVNYHSWEKKLDKTAWAFAVLKTRVCQHTPQKWKSV